ncbi:hypothetical protein BKA63DRAFT_36278 [Paraphoma chrysanthemicola]|nr:hypothetical protein BKA63DRAFT_36278 [Paraphoma chrysanthemicola]
MGKICIKGLEQPPLYRRKCIQISPKSSRTMLSTSSTSSKKGSRVSRQNTPGYSTSSRDQIPELSDVQCYTCRRRHVKCDRILPHCAKCAKKGVPCLGYRKPLRWAEGVAVRGKLKGKTQPVVDSQALSVSQVVVEEQRSSLLAEAAHFGIHASNNCCSKGTTTDATFLELIRYHNNTMCAVTPRSRNSLITIPKIAAITPRVAQNLPRNLLNCILGNAAVHMALRHPGNSSVEQLTLEAKVSLFEGISSAFQQPHQQRADILFTCTTLMFAMDIIENRGIRWSTHFRGALKLLASSGGMEHFASYYPHLRLQLARYSLCETMHFILSPRSIEEPRYASRNGLKTICFDPKVRESFFVASPLRLMRAAYDTEVCARTIAQSQDRPSAADVYTREWILADVLRFQPEEGTEDVRKTYFLGGEMTTAEAQSWNLVFGAWRGAIAIITLRHLFFGLPDPETPANLSRSPTPTPPTSDAMQSAFYHQSDDSYQSTNEATTSFSFDGEMEDYFGPEYLSAESQSGESMWSRGPSPLPSPRSSHDPITFDYWSRRYEIHNEAFAELSNSLFALSIVEDISYLRYALLPLVILALVSRPGSHERALCFSQFERFKQFMAYESAGPTPIGGSPLDFDIRWDLLDAYSTEMEQFRGQDLVYLEPELRDSAPEWNWLHMLKRINLKNCWPASSGQMHLELGTEAFAFNVLSACCTEECFEAFMQPLAAPSPASSAT